MGSGKQRDLTLRFVIERFPTVEYIVYIEDDAFIDATCLRSLINTLRVLPREYALVSPERGAKLCADFVVSKVMPSNRLYVALTGGSGAYVIRTDVVRELIRLGLGTYSSFIFFHWEDMEFMLKLWFMGFKTVSYELVCYRHVGRTSRNKPVYRRYTEYLGPLIAMVVDMPHTFLVKALPIRFIRDMVKSLIKGEVVLFVRAYLFIIVKLRLLLTHRTFRMRSFKSAALGNIVHNCVK
ncbi:hypothetical protein [Vulcanisaeta souniana]|uniref:Glycosyltransferase n=1 Tax=Vulcanisaeta souniana JCM 11219 TaxID=1293586 RepID=A0A830EA93_9CREN|nr:hypothetical protein [Vulcanisaeta souniana]BDR92690.1 hypothetical protein Vsou_17830 [Vulcanisaeta souniana JCM 11219]GGI84377.1 hypothetical protein GCM10007112_21650 [Vulcanisaeta souniana JCM 11219]